MKFYDEPAECWLCGKNGMKDPLDKHHIFGNAYRKKSEKYGLVVPLCHKECHQFGKYAAHQNAETMRRLHEYGQRKAMEEQGWTVQEFALEFGRNYLNVGPDDWDLTLKEIDRKAGKTGDGIPQSPAAAPPFDKGAMKGRKAVPSEMTIAWGAPLPF